MNLIRSADIESDDRTWEMIEAARAGDVPKMRALLQEHPGLYNAGYWYTQPLHFAVREGHLEAVKLLAGHGRASAIAQGDPKRRRRALGKAARLGRAARARGDRRSFASGKA